MAQDLPPPPEVRMTLDTPGSTDSEACELGAPDASEVETGATNQTEQGFAEPPEAWSRPPPANVVAEDLEPPTDDEHGAPRSSSNLLPLVLVGLAGLLLLGVLVLGFCGRRYNRRFQD